MSERRERTKSQERVRRRMIRLPSLIRPEAIDLHLELDPTQARFRGEASYALEVARRQQAIVLHAADLQVSRVRLRVGDEIWRGRVEMRREDEAIVLRFDQPIPAGACRLELAFRGRFRTDLRGLYRAETDGEAWLASQLCPTDARRAFPCFDEPGVKARYRIRVTAPREQAVISNSKIELEESTADASRKTVQFEETPPLSAYLVAVAVGPFEATPSLRSGATEIRVYTLPGRLALARFALEAAAASLERLEVWFDMPHPYSKLDLVALPAFAFGAMENAGAVFFRDSILLLDSAEAGTADRKRSAEVIAHELSHMWFGNLVTMAWWNDLWLNESFATWMAYEIVDSWQPDWRIWLDFAHRREHALEADSLASSHPIAPKIRSAEEAQENFDAITYTKGACVLRMLERYLGAEVFREGIRLYIRRHREGCAEAADLWTALAEVSAERIEEIVAPWTLQTGYPIVSVRRKTNKGRGIVELGQSRFLARPPHKQTPALARKQKRPDPLWKIPWIGRIAPSASHDDDEIRHLMTRARERLPDRDDDRPWLYGNAEESGFFRVDHGEDGLRDLLAGLQHLSPIERIGLVGHQWALSRCGRAPIGSLLDSIAALGGEEDPDVLAAVEGVLARLCRRLAPRRGRQIEEQLRDWIVGHFGEQLDTLGLAPRQHDSESTARQRARVFSIVGGLAAAEPVVEACDQQTLSHLETGRPLPPELGDVLLAIAAQHGNAGLHTALCNAARKASTPQNRQRALFALAEVSSPELIALSLAASDDATLAPLPDRASLLALMLSRHSAAPATWRHLQKRWRRLEKALPPILLARLAGATALALPPEFLSEIRAFFQLHPLAAGPRVLRQIGEEMAIARRFEAEAGPALDAYLDH